MNTLDRFRGSVNGSLQAQAIVASAIPMLAASMCVLGLFGALFFIQLGSFENELRIRSQSLADSLALQSELTALVGDSVEMERMARSVLAVEGALYVAVEDESATRLVTVTRAEFPEAEIVTRPRGAPGPIRTRGASSGHRFIEAAAIIRHTAPQSLLDWEESSPTTKTLGTVRVGLSTEAYHRMHQRSLWSVLIVGLLSLLLTVGVQHRQMRRILSPLSDLIVFTRKVAHGDLTQRATVVRNDEVGQLTEACNDMVRDLEKSHRTLVDAVEAANEASRLKSQFLANMSHEIRTPLNGVIGMTELALDRELPSDTREQLSTALSSAQTLLVVLNDVLDLSKIEAGKLDLDSVPFSVETLLENSAKAMAATAHRKGLELVCDIAHDVPRWAEGDPDRLRQVLTNLIANAIKFTKAGEVVVSVRMEAEGHDRVRLGFTVRDTGIGIPLEKQRSIFDAFTQADGSMTREYGGTGLGLTICARLVSMMNGSIGVTSEPGTGSSFHFTADLLRSAESEAKANLTATTVSFAGLRTLVVDDNETNRTILENVLRSWDMDVMSVKSGPAALDALNEAKSARRPFQMVILDLMMPGMDGVETARHIRDTFAGEPPVVMMLSSGTFGADNTTLANLGISRYVMKPVGRHELREVIRTMMRPDSALNSERQSKVIQRANLQTGALSILIAEDNPVNVKVLEALLRTSGHRVHAVRDGAEAIAAYERQHFDIILMDVQMPRMNGLEATGVIRAKEETTGAHIPIVALTAHALKGDREICLEAGMDGYVTKPITRPHLLQAIDNAMTVAQPSVRAASHV